MKKIIIANKHARAVILPDFGGMVAELSIEGIDVLRMNYGSLGLANVLSGGIPVLFPFVSRSKNDEATFLGETLTMPMHGFVKDMPFQVVRSWANGCELCLESTSITKRMYPYDFALTMIYEIENSDLKTTMRVENHSNAPMPFAAGYHPYFLTPNRSETTFSFGLTNFSDYTKLDECGNPANGILDGGLCLADTHDTVFWKGCADSEITSREIGYRANLLCGETFDVMTICTTQENASCIEPWQARPGAAHCPEACQVLEPNATGDYVYTIRLEKL